MSVSPRVLSALLALLVAFSATGSVSAQVRQSKLDRVLGDAARSGSRTAQRVIVQTRPGGSAALKTVLQSHGDVVEAEHPGLDALTVTVHGQDLAALEAHPAVVAVSTDAEVTSFGDRREYNDSRSRRGYRDDDDDRGYSRNERNDGYGALSVLRASLGLETSLFSGEGVNVAILDSGIAPTDNLASHIAGFWDFTRGGLRTAAYDDYGHGTHIAGLIACDGDSRTGYAGVAPGVRLYGFKVLDKFGRGRASDVVKALEWIVANKRSTARGAVKIDIVNLSLGHPVFEPAVSDPLVRAVENAVRAGIVVVTAAGNRGKNDAGEVGYAAVTSPGNAPSAITVGAVDSKGTASRRDDRVAGFSSRGPTWFDGFAKPEIVAPGVGLTSEAADDMELYKEFPELRLTGRYRRLARMSGTSMAAATATGVAALALQASRAVNDGRGLSPNALKAVLQYTAVEVVKSNGQADEPLAQGAGQVNARGAIALALTIDTQMSVGQSWLRAHLRPFSTIDGDSLAWSRAVVWNDSVIRGSDVLSFHSDLWANNIVWGTGCDTDASHCLTQVWGAAAGADNIVWGTGLEWAARLALDNRLLGLLISGDNIVWGTLAGLAEDNIVWGTRVRGDNIVWGTMRGDNIVWGTFIDGDNIVWGTLAVADNIVWGTLSGLLNGGRQ